VKLNQDDAGWRKLRGVLGSAFGHWSSVAKCLTIDFGHRGVTKLRVQSAVGHSVPIDLV
jgi:hypothetical protein